MKNYNESTKIPGKNYYYSGSPDLGFGIGYDVLTFTNPGGVLNMLSNNTLFDVVSAKDAFEKGIDLTGAIGVTGKSGTMSGYDMIGLNAKWMNYDYKYFDHVYVSVDKKSSEIAESSARGGIEIRKQSIYYSKRTSYYLIFKAFDYRMY